MPYCVLVARLLVVAFDDAGGTSMPARLVVARVGDALADAVRAVDFVGFRRQDEQRIAIKVEVRILFKLLLRFGDGRLPAPRIFAALRGGVIEGCLNNFLEYRLIQVHRFPSLHAVCMAAILFINIAKATEGTEAKADWPLCSLAASVTVAKLPLPVRSTVTAKFSVMTVSVSNLLRLSKFIVALRSVVV